MKKCLFCGDIFYKPYKYSKKQWSMAKYCSKKCSAINRDNTISLKRLIKLNMSRIGVPLSKEHKNRISIGNSGKKKPQFSEEHKRNLGLSRVGKFVGDKSPSWKGDNVGYYGLHQWVYKTLGKPHVCSYCGTKESYRFEWANISGEYKRDIKDWVRLCVKCHRKKDDNVNKMWMTIKTTKSDKLPENWK